MGNRLLGPEISCKHFDGGILLNSENHQNEQNLTQIHWNSCQIHRIFIKLRTFRVFQAPPQPTTTRQTKYLDPKASHEKKVIFSEIIFSQKFSLFSRPQNPKIRDLAIWRCAHPYSWFNYPAIPPCKKAIGRQNTNGF